MVKTKQWVYNIHTIPWAIRILFITTLIFTISLSLTAISPDRLKWFINQTSLDKQRRWEWKHVASRRSTRKNDPFQPPQTAKKKKNNPHPHKVPSPLDENSLWSWASAGRTWRLDPEAQTAFQLFVSRAHTLPLDTVTQWLSPPCHPSVSHAVSASFVSHFFVSVVFVLSCFLLA